MTPMNAAFCLMRLGAPHEGHVGLAELMRERCPGSPLLILVGSAEVVGRPDAPLPWELRRDILLRMLHSRGWEEQSILFAPLVEIPLLGFTHQWFVHLLNGCKAVLPQPPDHYFFGDDYQVENFDLLKAILPTITLHRVPRIGTKSGTEFRRALVTGDEALLSKYAFELAHYPASAIDQIVRVSGPEFQQPAPL